MCPFADVLFFQSARKALQFGIDRLCLEYQKKLEVSHAFFGWRDLCNVETLDPYMRIGTKIGINLVEEMECLVGDGAKMALFLLSRLLTFGLEFLESRDLLFPFVRGMEKEQMSIVEILDQLSVPCKNREETLFVAASASHGNLQMAKEVSDLCFEIGLRGEIAVLEESVDKREKKISGAVKEGIVLDHGYVSSFFCSDREKQIFDAEYPLLIVSNKQLEDPLAVLSLLEEKKSVLILAPDFGEDFLATLKINRIKNDWQICPVKISSHSARLFLDLTTDLTPPSFLWKMPFSRAYITRDKSYLFGDFGKNKKPIGILFLEEIDQKERQLVQKSLAATRAAQKGGYLADGGRKALLAAAKESAKKNERNGCFEQGEEAGRTAVLQALYSLEEFHPYARRTSFSLEKNGDATEVIKQAFSRSLCVAKSIFTTDALLSLPTQE